MMVISKFIMEFHTHNIYSPSSPIYETQSNMTWSPKLQVDHSFIILYDNFMFIKLWLLNSIFDHDFNDIKFVV